MKFSKYLMMAGAAAMLTACSSEEPIVGPDQNGNASDGEVYAYFNIALSDNGGTRASTATAGSEEEYAVKNGKILIFGMKAGVEDNLDNRVASTYIAAADLEFVEEKDEDGKVTNPVPDADNNLDLKYTKVRAKFEKGTFQTEYAKFYGVCVLNYDAAATGNNSWLPAATGTTTFEDWAENSSLEGAYINSNGFVMTNAATFDGSQAHVLSPITTGTGYIEDEAKDLKYTAASFTVQRVAAKVSITAPANIKNFEYEVKDADDAVVATATFKNWALDNTRKTSYPVQNVWDSNVSNLFKSSTRYVERGLCMWASGKFYTNATDGFANNHYNRYTVNGLEDMTTTDLYVRENTTAPDQMSKATCTRVVVKATYKLATSNSVETLIGINDNLYTVSTLKALVEKNVGEEYTVVVNADASKSCNFEDVVKITKGTDNADAAVYRAAAAKAGVINYAGNEVNYYLNGECWYVAYVKHFGTETDGLTTQIFPNQYTPAYTGRYGILRNNWYELNLKSVKGIGMPVVPDPDPNHTPDDDGKRTERNMDVDINILNWAKRTQNVEF